jgi:hypothetical protein
VNGLNKVSKRKPVINEEEGNNAGDLSLFLSLALFSGEKSGDKSEMGEALEWIRESLQDVLDDRDEESSEGIPLVPLTDHSSAAMDSPSFQKLLRALGFAPPADAQESYWRIPVNMLTTTIQKRCKLIGNALAGEFVIAGKRSARAAPRTDRDFLMEIYVHENILQRRNQSRCIRTSPTRMTARTTTSTCSKT